MIKEIRTNAKFYIAIILVMILQILTLLYWMNEKSNYSVDELLSMSYSRVYGSETPTMQYVQDSPDWKDDEWVEAYDLKKYYHLNEDTDFFPTSPARIVKGFTKSKPYFLLLNLSRSISGSMLIDKYPGLILNIVLFVLCEITLIAFGRVLNMRKPFIILMLAMFGFSGIIISISEYIRFYIFAEWMLLLMLLSVALFRKCKTVWAAVLLEALACFCAFSGMKNSELVIISAGALFVYLFIDLIVGKQWKKLIVHSAYMAAAFVFLLLKTPFINMLLHPSAYAGNTAVGDKLFMHLTSVSFRSLEELAIFITDTYSRYLFNGMPVFFLWIAALTVLFVALGRKKAGEEQSIPVTVFVLWIVWATFAIISFFVIRFRLIMFCGFVAYSLWVFLPLIKKKLKNVKLSGEDVMALMTAGTALAHAAFIALAYLDHIIYLSFSLVAFMPAFWYAIDKSFQKLDIRPERKRVVYAIPVVITVIGCLMPFATRDIRFIFEDDRELVSAVSAYQDKNPDANVVLMTKSKELQGDALDCIWQMDDDTNIYINDYEELEYTAGIYPDDFLLWTESYRDMSLFFDGLKEEGYSYSKLGEDHICIVYEVER